MQVIKAPINTILLIDDNKDDCDVFEQAMKVAAETVKFSFITECEDVLKALADYQPDLIFLDINMPRLSGFDCLKKIEQSTQYSHIPIVMYSSTENSKEINAAYTLGATLYFQKPTSFYGLVEALKRIIEMSWDIPAVIKSQYYSQGSYFPYKASV